MGRPRKESEEQEATGITFDFDVWVVGVNAFQDKGYARKQSLITRKPVKLFKAGEAVEFDQEK